MLPDEISMALSLGRCNFVPATQAKRFAAEISSRAASKEPQISEGEAGYLRSCVYTFRRQIAPSIVAMAGDVPAERARREAMADRPIASRTSMDPELADDERAPTPMPRDPDSFDLFGDDEPPRKGPGDTEPTDSEGRESRTSDLGREESRR